MIPSVSLVIVMVVFYKERRILRKWIYNSASKLIFAGLKVFKSLSTHSCFFLISCFFTIFRVKISIGIYPCHVIHCYSCRSFNSCIKSCCVYSHSSPATDTDDSDPVRINLLIQGKKINCRHEIFCVDIRRCHVSYISTGLSCK